MKKKKQKFLYAMKLFFFLHVIGKERKYVVSSLYNCFDVFTYTYNRNQ